MLPSFIWIVQHGKRRLHTSFGLKAPNSTVDLHPHLCVLPSMSLERASRLLSERCVGLAPHARASEPTLAKLIVALVPQEQ